MIFIFYEMKFEIYESNLLSIKNNICIKGYINFKGDTEV